MLGLVTSAAAQAMNGIVAAIHPLLKDLRYRKRRNTFNRVMHPDGLIHVINFQMGPFDPPGTAEITACDLICTAGSRSTSEYGSPA